MKKSGLLAILATGTMAFSLSASAMILPPNNLYRFDNVHRLANMTEQQFNLIADFVVNIYQPYAKLHGANLSVNKRWDDPTVNAYAEQDGNNWVVNMFGGLARRPEITADGFALVVCHELGHHFGGHYFYEGSDQWAAAEGQADYFATQVCAKEVFRKTPWLNPRFRQGVPPIVQQNCDMAWKAQPDRDLCYRSAAAGLSLAQLLGALGGNGAPKFETPDKSVIGETFTGHPQAQCRLDTFFMGALCPVEFDPKIIPGKGLPEGQNSAKAEQIAYQYSCGITRGFKIGYRPLCWFHPQTGGAPGFGPGFGQFQRRPMPPRPVGPFHP